MVFHNGKGKTETIDTRGVILIPSGISHIASTEKGCKLIGITIPADTGYPNNKNQNEG